MDCSDTTANKVDRHRRTVLKSPIVGCFDPQSLVEMAEAVDGSVALEGFLKEGFERFIGASAAFVEPEQIREQVRDALATDPEAAQIHLETWWRTSDLWMRKLGLPEPSLAEVKSIIERHFGIKLAITNFSQAANAKQTKDKEINQAPTELTKHKAEDGQLNDFRRRRMELLANFGDRTVQFGV